MKNFRLTYTIIVAFLFFCGCASTGKLPQEKCIENCSVPEDFRKPPIGCFVGISKLCVDEQKAINDAMVHAREQIVDHLGIKVDRKLLEELLTRGKTSEILDTDVSEIALTKMVAENIIVGTRMSKYLPQRWQWFRGDEIKYYYKVYVLVEFSRAENEKFITTLFTQALKYGKQIYSKGQNNEKQGDIQRAINYYYTLLNMSEYLGDITPPETAIPAKEELRKVRADAKVAIQSIISRIKLEKLTGDTEVKERIGKLSVPLRIKVTYKQTPLVDFPILFRFKTGGGILDTRIPTNRSGIALCKVSRYEIPPDKREVIVAAQPDIGEVCLEALEVPKVSFVIKYVPKDIAVQIMVGAGINEHQIQGVKQAVGQNLREKGFKVVKVAKAQLLAQGMISLESSKFITSFGETFACSEVSLSLRVVNISKDEVLFSQRITQKGWDNDNLQEATQNALYEITKDIPGILNDLR